MKKVIAQSILFILLMGIIACTSGGETPSPSNSDNSSSPKINLNTTGVAFEPPNQVNTSDTLITEGKLD